MSERASFIKRDAREIVNLKRDKMSDKIETILINSMRINDLVSNVAHYLSVKFNLESDLDDLYNRHETIDLSNDLPQVNLDLTFEFARRRDKIENYLISVNQRIESLYAEINKIESESLQ